MPLKSRGRDSRSLTLNLSSITEKQCAEWADRLRGQIAPSAFNRTLGVLRNTLDFGIHAGARYNNPAMCVMRESERPKELELSTSAMFGKLVSEIEHSGSGKSKLCAELVQFLAYGGFRKGEAAYVTRVDCDLERGIIIARGHPETRLKNRNPGETRIIQMIPDMRRMHEKMRRERNSEPSTTNVMRVRECQKSIDRACTLHASQPSAPVCDTEYRIRCGCPYGVKMAWAQRRWSTCYEGVWALKRSTFFTNGWKSKLFFELGRVRIRRRFALR